MLERIAAQDGSGRLLLINTTNVDLGDSRPWDLVAQSKAALAGGDPERVHRILLASAGIPAIFPARAIGEHLYVDGAITGNILYGARVDQETGLAAQWRAKHGRAPAPRVRYWVIFNNQFRFPPQVTQERWPDIMSRATIMSTQTSTVNSMRHLYAQAEIARLKYGADVEVRLMAVPDAWIPPSPGTFQANVMNELADLGEKMGADPANWRTEAPERRSVGYPATRAGWGWDLGPIPALRPICFNPRWRGPTCSANRAATPQSRATFRETSR
jgi:hypothetical protein